MTTTTTAPHDDALRALTDRAAIEDLVTRFLLSLDESVLGETALDDAWAAAFFTDDAHVAFPVGEARGRTDVRQLIVAGMRPFGRTVHFGTDHLIELDGDRARARGKQLSTHLIRGGDGEPFVSAGLAEHRLRRTDQGWRIAATELRVLWTTGTPPAPAAVGDDGR